MLLWRIGTLRSLPSAENPIQLPSGEKNGAVPLYIEDAAGVTDDGRTDSQLHATSLPGRAIRATFKVPAHCSRAGSAATQWNLDSVDCIKYSAPAIHPLWGKRGLGRSFCRTGERWPSVIGEDGSWATTRRAAEN